ncbi:MAG: response regulator [Sporomusaceae bacterium]|nr:response regulator [Sporomusaceae bacterium]
MHKNKVLFVDDEINVISAIRRAVMEEPYQSFFTGNAREALKIMEEQEISVLVTDMRMPEMDGLTLLKAAKEKYPRTVRVVLSGYTQLSQMLVTINQGEIFKFIAKPWASDQALLPAVRQAVEYFNLQVERDSLQINLAKRNLAYQKILNQMEQRLAEEREEFRRLKEISGWIFSTWRRYLSSGNNDSGARSAGLDQFVDEIEAVYLTYISQLPTEVESKDSGQLINDIVKSCNGRFEVVRDGDEEFKAQGNHKFLLMIFRILAHNLPGDNKIDCAVTVACRDEQKVVIGFAVDLLPLALDAAAINRLKISCALLNKMGRLYDVRVVPEGEEGGVSRISVTWKADKA